MRDFRKLFADCGLYGDIPVSAVRSSDVERSMSCEGRWQLVNQSVGRREIGVRLEPGFVFDEGGVSS